MIALIILLTIHQSSPISILPNPRPHLIPTSRGTSHCTLQPLGSGYYLGINRVTFTTAGECCISKNLELAQSDGSNVEVVRGVLVSGEFLQHTEPIGKHSSLWVNSTGGLCTSVFLGSWRSPVLRTYEHGCGDSRAYVCHDGYFSQVDCSRVQYTEFQVDGVRKRMAYSGVKLSWPDAYACCESRSQTLLRLHPSTTVKILQHVSRFGGSPLIWTGGYKSLDLALTNQFKWTDNNDVSLLHNAKSWRTENCVAADLKSDYKNGLHDYGCEVRLNYVCDNEAPTPCDDIEWRNVRVNSSGRTYVFGVNGKMSFEGAKGCCGKMNGYRVLSVVSVVEGGGLALALEKDSEVEGKVRGYGGVWVGAMKGFGGKYNYFQLDGSPNFTMSGYSRFLGGGGDCLSFSVDVRMSFVLRGVGCGVSRGVICEKIVQFRDADDVKFVDVGNLYFYSRTPLSHADANMTCKNNRMRLLEFEDLEEMSVVVDGVSQFKNHTTYLSGFWTGHKHYNIPLHDLPSSLMNFYVDKPWNVRNLREMHHGVDEYGGVINDRARCHESFWMVRGGEVVVEQRKSNCSRVLNFVCEVVGDGAGEVGVSGEELIGANSDIEMVGEWEGYGECGGGAVDRDVWVSGGEATWYKARECCSHLTPNHTFELVSMDAMSMKQHLDEQTLVDVGLYEKIRGLGFWTSGSNVVGTFAWLGSNYSFIREDVFYNELGNETVEETRDVCLQAFYSSVDKGLRVVGKGCSEKSQFVCGRKFGSSMEYPPCDHVLYERIGESSYFLSWDRMPWVRAADCCTQRSSVLAKIATKQESAYLARSLLSLLHTHSLVDQGAWIGLVKPTDSTNFTWVDGTTFNLTSYRHTHGVDDGNHPGHDGTGDKCVGVFTSEAHKGGLVWKVLGCHEKLWSVCHADWDADGNDSVME